MKNIYRIMLVLCITVLLTGVAFGYAEYANVAVDNVAVDNVAVDNVAVDNVAVDNGTVDTVDTVDDIIVDNEDTASDTQKSPGFEMIITIGAVSIIYILKRR